MAESYSRIQSRIAQLQRQAEGMRRSEMAGVVKKIKVAIDAYGLTAEDLFGTDARARSTPATASRRARSADDTSRYSDGQGNTWGGRGPRPKWLRDAIGGGKSLEEFATGKAGPTPRSAGPAPAAKGKGKTGKGIAIKYRDGDNTWTGRGSQPRWLRSALSDGKTLEQFTV